MWFRKLQAGEPADPRGAAAGGHRLRCRSATMLPRAAGPALPHRLRYGALHLPVQQNLGLPAAIGILVACMLVGGSRAGQSGNPEEQSQDVTLRVSVSVVTVGVRVTDRKGRHVAGLRRSDFSLYEDGLLQQIAFFSEEEQPISLGILLDRSRSMLDGSKLELAKTAALSLLSGMHPGNEVQFLPFDHLVDRGTHFTTVVDQVVSAIRATEAGQGTALYDAILTGLERCGGARYPRQALVVISDGADQHSDASLDDVIYKLQESQVQLHLVGYFSNWESDLFRHSGKKVTLSDFREIDNPRVVFRRLSEESGAASFFPQSDRELSRAAEEISSDLRRQYTLAYYPPNPSALGEYRRISVKVGRRGTTVRTRRGYRLPAGTAR